MCLAVPGQVQSLYQADDILMGKVSFGGIIKEVCLDFLRETTVGDFVIVHVGFAISKIDEATAQETLRMLSQLGQLEEELGPAESES